MKNEELRMKNDVAYPTSGARLFIRRKFFILHS